MLGVNDLFVNPLSDGLLCMQCGADISWSVFSKILTIDTPKLGRVGEVWGVSCDV